MSELSPQRRVTQYIALIRGDYKTPPATADWEAFFAAARQSGCFKGGSAIGNRLVVGAQQAASPADHVAGYMRFDSDDKQALLDLLANHPVVVHGGSLELCEMVES
jgi:hypothetical protein